MAAPACSSTTAISRPASATRCRRSRQHRYEDVLASPGEADLTAHVDFAALAACARPAWARRASRRRRATSCSAWACSSAPARLGANADAATRERLQGEVERLAGPDAMGTLFKVLAVAPRRRPAAALRRAPIDLHPCPAALSRPGTRIGTAGRERVLTNRFRETTRRRMSDSTKPDPLRVAGARRNCSRPASATAFSPASAAFRDGIYRRPQHRHRLARRSGQGAREPPPRRRLDGRRAASAC